MAGETIPPMAIIAGATALMGAVQGWIHYGFYGKPKAVNQDPWDRRLIVRDDILKHEAQVRYATMRPLKLWQICSL